jgi:hypothetical protein
MMAPAGQTASARLNATPGRRGPKARGHCQNPPQSATFGRESCQTSGAYRHGVETYEIAGDSGAPGAGPALATASLSRSIEDANLSLSLEALSNREFGTIVFGSDSREFKGRIKGCSAEG